MPRALSPYPQLSDLTELAKAIETEHATKRLAASAGIRTAITRVIPLPERKSLLRHAIRIERFDRIGTVRMHCSPTALRAVRKPESYSALAGVLLRLGHPERQATEREELFKRMVFNTYDVAPNLHNMDYQSMIVDTRGAESRLDNAQTRSTNTAFRQHAQ